MARNYKLKERGTGVTLYPETSTEQVYGPDGNNLKTTLPKMQEQIDGKQGKLATSEGLTIDGGVLSLTERAKQHLFDDLWKVAVGSYGTVDHTHVEGGIKKPYYLNELWLTYKEAVAIYQAYLNRTLTQSDAYMNYTGRTQIPTRVYGPINLNSVLRGSYVTHARLTQTKKLSLFADSLGEYMFSTARSVAAAIKKWLDVVVLFGSGNPALESSIVCFINAPKLEYFRIQNVNKDVYLNQSSNIGIDSLQYLIANRYPLTSSNAKAFSIIVHPDVYSKLTDPDNAEWYPLLAQAAEKNIQFATT